MTRYLIIVILTFTLTSCEETNIILLTDAASDAVTALSLSDEDVKLLARQAATSIDRQHKLAHQGNPYETRLRKLLPSCLQARTKAGTFDFKVYLTKEINAFAMADGTVRVYSGLMDLMNDEELLFVIGHEMGHVVKEHSRKKVVLAYGSSALRKGLAAQKNEVGQIARSVLGGFAEQLTNAQFSQHEEHQADQYGLDFLKSNDHPPEAAISALKKLAELAKQHTILSSHPNPKARIKSLNQPEKEQNKDSDSLLSTIFKFLEMIVVAILQLILALLNWLLSLF